MVVGVFGGWVLVVGDYVVELCGGEILCVGGWY